MKHKGVLLILFFLVFVAGMGQIPGLPKSVRIPISQNEFIKMLKLITPTPTHTSKTLVPPTKDNTLDYKPYDVTVERIIDGDTVELSNGEKVRYIGIDAPEKQNPKECFSGESTQANSNLVLHKTVRLELDKSNRDRYGRLLRYVYVQPESSGAAELFVNDYLVRNGYALSKGYKPDIHKQAALDSAQREASAAGRGLWSVCK